MKASFAALALIGFATAATAAPQAEQNVPAGSLGVAALAQADYATAESQIVGTGEASRDPAKLINLGHVYLRTGRAQQAIDTWQQASRLPNQYDVVTADGSVKNTRDIARAALDRYRFAARAQ